LSKLDELFEKKEEGWELYNESNVSPKAPRWFTYRLRIEGGWLYKVNDDPVVFVPMLPFRFDLWGLES
jgi:hypothetical protein